MSYFIIGVITGMLIGFFVAGLLYSVYTVNDAIETEQQKAVRAKVGSWFINEDTGESEFVYGSPVDLEEYDPKEIAIEITEEHYRHPNGDFKT